MSALVAARVGALTGLACAAPVAVWLGLQVPDPAPGLAMHLQALQALWIAQGIAIALVVPRCIGSTWSEGAFGGSVLVAAPLPLTCVAWLAGAAPAAALATGTALLLVYAAGLAALATWLARVLWREDILQIVTAAAELAMVAAVWTFREHWLSWSGV